MAKKKKVIVLKKQLTALNKRKERLQIKHRKMKRNRHFESRKDESRRSGLRDQISEIEGNASHTYELITKSSKNRKAKKKRA